MFWETSEPNIPTCPESSKSIKTTSSIGHRTTLSEKEVKIVPVDDARCSVGCVAISLFRDDVRILCIHMCNQASLQELVAALKCNFLSTVTSGSSALRLSTRFSVFGMNGAMEAAITIYLFSFFLKLFTRFCLLLCLLGSWAPKAFSSLFISSPRERREIYSQRKLQSFVVENFLHRFTIFHFLPWSKHYVIYWARGDVTGARGGEKRGGQSLGTIYENVIDGPAVKSAGVGRRLPLKVGGLQWKRLFKALIRGEWHVNETGCEKKGERKSIKCRIYEFSFSFASLWKLHQAHLATEQNSSLSDRQRTKPFVLKATKAKQASPKSNSIQMLTTSPPLSFIRFWMPMMCNKKSINKRNKRAE